MKSPFPGMDPYLEEHWSDVHASLITYARDQLRPQLPGDLRARVEEHVAVREEEEERPQSFYPDVSIAELPEGDAGRSESPSAVGVAEPLVVPNALEPRTERWIQIIDTRSGNRVVTAIEFLSPWNKQSLEGRQAYRNKQRAFIEGGANLVEIDLVRSGQHVLAVDPFNIPAIYQTPYRICVTRMTHRRDAEIYRAPLDERLPKIRIPLRPADADVYLDLQGLVDQAYENGSYQDIDYNVEPLPPLQPTETPLVDKLLCEKGVRKAN